MEKKLHRRFAEKVLVLVLFLHIRETVCEDRQLAYGVHPDFQEIAHTRLAQLEERTALDCKGAGATDAILWYRRSLQTSSASLGDQERIYETLLVDWKWTPHKERRFLEQEHPQTYKFEISGARLIIHVTRWHDLGQYYCVVGDEVKTIYLLYQRPIILFATPEEKLKKHELNAPETIKDPHVFADRLNNLREDTAEQPLDLNGKARIRAMWRAYPFVDRQSTAPEGFTHSGYNWDEGDVCRWMNLKQHDSNYKKAFMGKVGTDVETFKPEKRYFFTFDAALGQAEWIINGVTKEDERNVTLSVQTSRGASWAFLFIRVRDPNAYFLPMIIVIVEVVFLIIFNTIVVIIDKKKERQQIDQRNRQTAVEAPRSSGTGKEQTNIPPAASPTSTQLKQQQQQQQQPGKTATPAPSKMANKNQEGPRSSPEEQEDPAQNNSRVTKKPKANGPTSDSNSNSTRKSQNTTTMAPTMTTKTKKTPRMTLAKAAISIEKRLAKETTPTAKTTMTPSKKPQRTTTTSFKTTTALATPTTTTTTTATTTTRPYKTTKKTRPKTPLMTLTEF